MAIQVSINGYDGLEQIGVGGMAAVYKARKTSIDKIVAIKVLFPYLASDESFIDRFQREAKAAAKIQHENIVNVIDFGESEGSYYIVMEYYDGQTLDEILKTRHGLPLDVAVMVLLEVCYGLESAHAKDIVHRDIKPGNIIYTNQGGIKIADFGLAKKSDSMTMITQQGKVIGTPAYMSPEQAAGRNVGPQSDVFSLGVVAFELLCKQKPFAGTSYSDVLEKIQTHEPPSVANLNPLIQPDFEHIVARMLEKDLAKRYQSVTDVIQDVEKGMEKFHMTRDRRRLSKYIRDPATYEEAFREKTIARCLSQGAFFMKKGQTHFEEAALEFERILHLDPDNERARKNLDRINTERGKDRTVTIEPPVVAARRDAPRKKHDSVSVVAASGRRGRGRGARRFFGGLAIVAALAAAGYVAHERRLIDLSFLRSSGNHAPVLSVPRRVAVSEGDVVEFALQAVDADGDTVRFYAEDLPTGAKLTDDGEFIWRVEESQTGSHKLRFYADDGEAAAISETVVDVGRTAASLDFSKVGTVRVNREKGIRKTLKATSSSGRPVGFELVKAPAGMKLDGNQIVWLPEKDGSFRATVKASDGLMSKTQTVTFQVRDPRAAQAAAMGHVEWQLPETADIFVDGALKAKDDNRLAVDLPEGRYELTAELSDGVTAWRETVDVRGGEKVRLRATDVSFGSLSVYFLGGVGEFKLDGKKFNRQPPFTRARVPAGEHRASCRMADDLEPRDFKIVVKPDAETVIEYEVGRPPVVTESD